uniref:Helicase-associated domain-containing protein n=1 Tax=Corethron hystrix TaxID=216773 RepID=A0A7S1FSJ8_9STRA|mmetsp:Transcript_25609/g.59094  ORF Transcript_25609/g.59094 Transcript_25609/m.59094 type:complete len:455 (+) Transcript_25609:72-1436(+)
MLLFGKKLAVGAGEDGGTKPNQWKYYSVRKGRTVSSCIFLFWQDCKHQIDGFDKAEYAIFTDLLAAAKFAQPPANDARMKERLWTMPPITPKLAPPSTAALVSIPTQKGTVPLPPQTATPEFLRNKLMQHNRARMKAGLKPVKQLPPPVSVLPPKNSGIGFVPAASSKPIAAPVAVHSSTGYGLLGPTSTVNSKVNNCVPPKHNINPSAQPAVNISNLNHVAKPLDVNSMKNAVTTIQTLQQVNRIRKKIGLPPLTSTSNNLPAVVPAGKKRKLPQTQNNNQQRPSKNLLQQEDPLVEKKWQEQYAKLKDYREKNGNCDIAATHELAAWVHAQRYDYLSLIDGNNASRMTTSRLSALNELGFLFGYKTWGERLGELREFRRLHGHLRVPRNHPGLGLFVSYVHDTYWNGTIDATRKQQLQALGFDFGKLKGEGGGVLSNEMTNGGVPERPVILK